MDHLQGLHLGEHWNPKYYRPNLFDSSEHDFHKFPEQIHFTPSKETQEYENTKPESKISFNHFLQSWLFFGLLSTILQKPSKTLVETLVVEGNIDTTRLTGYLEGWRTDVKKLDPHPRSLRMIRAQVALDKARQVVTEYCSDDGKRRKTNPNNPCYVEHKLSLSLMVLGETLTNAKSKIIEQVGFNIRGWHGDAMEGWGTPSRVLEKMESKGWCRKLVEILKQQLRLHATSMLAAYASHSQTDAETSYLIEGHKDCDKDKCRLKFPGSGGEYVTQHQLTCRRNPKHKQHVDDKKLCFEIGPDMKDVVEIIKKGRVPLLEYNRKKGKVDVVEYEPYTTYATLSHVWSDGYGNPKVNELWKCQLDFFDELFTEAHEESRATVERKLFWIDTLAIPIHEDHRDERRIAVRQIHQVYTNARYTVVIDKGLGQMLPATTYEGTAMRILASGWMRRLWTLQEAYLSRRLYFAFANGKDLGEDLSEEGLNGRLKNLEALEEMYPKASDILTSNIPSAARNYFHNLLGNDRRARINELPAGNGTDILASVWRAARWRTTNHQEHETLALATLLNLEYTNTKLQDAGLIKKAAKVEDEQLQGMMIDLWKILDKTCPGSIPPGIIFLPGEKLKDPSFGWAPKTWLSNEELEYPDPLSNMVGAARLVPEGLLVQYPGFVLHAQNRASILRENESSFHFPSDSTLLEWYGVELTGLRNNPPKGIEKDEKQLAIILCRPKPKEIPEIALLVQIEEKIVQRSFNDKHHHSVIYHVSYDRRVKIWRETNADLLSKWREYITASIDLDEKNLAGDSQREDKMICGEALDSDQRWYVGGRPPPKDLKVKTEDEETKKAPAQKVTVPSPIESGENRAARPIARPVGKTGPMTINPLGGPSISFPKSSYGPSTARQIPITVSVTQRPLDESYEPPTTARPPLQHFPVQPPEFTPTSHTTTSTSLGDSSPLSPATGTRTRSVSSVSNTSQTLHTPPQGRNSNPSPAVNPSNPGNLPSPPDSEHSTPRGGSGSRIPKAVSRVGNGSAAAGHSNGGAR